MQKVDIDNFLHYSDESIKNEEELMVKRVSMNSSRGDGGGDEGE